jgi:hypothetical protein
LGRSSNRNAGWLVIVLFLQGEDLLGSEENLPFFESAGVLVRFNYAASGIINANLSIM